MPLLGWTINAFVKSSDVVSVSFQALRATNIAVLSARMQTRRQGGEPPTPNR
jgi:hypothetical protein